MKLLTTFIVLLAWCKNSEWLTLTKFDWPKLLLVLQPRFFLSPVSLVVRHVCPASAPSREPLWRALWCAPLDVFA